MYVNCSSKCTATSRMYHITRDVLAPHENMYVNCSSKCTATSRMYHITRDVLAPEINITFNTYLDECMLKFAAFEFLSNRYQPTVVQFQYTCAQIITKKLFDLDSLFTKCISPRLFPILPNVKYVVKGWQPDPDKFPNAYTTGRYKVEAVIFANSNEELAKLFWYYKLDEVSVF
ncbi:hypothetical protein QE152_g4094 [Popillia japonica]|uniref:Uncharacterized protein n=1 Tax=Popillia japonica TaxID=7064 RepID=A0AAW1N1B3_POPJA